MKILKKIIFLMMLNVIIIASFGTMLIDAFADENVYTVSATEAQKVAISQIQMALLYSENNRLESWHWGIEISEAHTMYDFNNEVSGYYFLIYNEKGDDAGYIVVGAKTSYAPVIEYATSGSFYPAKELVAKGRRHVIGNDKI